jgi:TorA maturation chaperone TorD
LLDLAKNRAKAYGILSLVYISPPSVDVLKTLQVFCNLFTGYPLPQQMRKFLMALNGFLADNGNSARYLTHSIEFTRLFGGVSGAGAVPSYESVYSEGLCWGESTAKVVEEYRHFGLRVKDENEGEPPDHISLELDFMRFLCEKEADAWRNDDRKAALLFLNSEKRFLREHLSRWAADFCEGIRIQDKLGFYRCWADVTESWVEFDHEQIEILQRDILEELRSAVEIK